MSFDVRGGDNTPPSSRVGALARRIEGAPGRIERERPGRTSAIRSNSRTSRVEAREPSSTTGAVLPVPAKPPPTWRRRPPTRSYSERMGLTAFHCSTVGGSFRNALSTAQLRPHGRIHPKQHDKNTQLSQMFTPSSHILCLNGSWSFTALRRATTGWCTGSFRCV